MRDDLSWIPTYTGKCFYPLDPHPDDIDITDIAHHLANLCRFTGATRTFYSVAQHSVLVSEHVPPQDALWGLLHDAPEAYINDLSRPLKRSVQLRQYRLVEDRLSDVIALHFGLSVRMPASVHQADMESCLTEKRDLFQNLPARKWEYCVAPWSDVVIVPWIPEVAERKFLDRYEELTGVAVA